MQTILYNTIKLTKAPNKLTSSFNKHTIFLLQRTLKAFHLPAQGCRRSRLPWVPNQQQTTTLKGLKQSSRCFLFNSSNRR